MRSRVKIGRGCVGTAKKALAQARHSNVPRHDYRMATPEQSAALRADAIAKGWIIPAATGAA